MVNEKRKLLGEAERLRATSWQLHAAIILWKTNSLEDAVAYLRKVAAGPAPQVEQGRLWDEKGAVP